MNYLSGALRYVAGGDNEPESHVPRLVDRIKTSAMPHDRRDAIVQLTDATKHSPSRQAQVGEHALKLIYAVLEQDVEFDDTVKATLELLIALCGALEPPTAPGSQYTPSSRAAFLRDTRAAATTNIDAFLGLPNALTLLLALLERPDFYVKFGTIELLTAMTANSRNTLQAAILESPQGVTRICDVLEDQHRHIRSNAVLLLSALCDQSPEICKIIVFGGAFEKLFSFIDAVASPSRSEVLSDDDDDTVEDAIVVQDILFAVRNLLIGAPSTKTFFRDSTCVPRLVTVLQRAAADASFVQPDASKPAATQVASTLRAAIEAQARRNLLVAMQCVASLVSGSDEETQKVKSELATTKLFKTLTALAFQSPPSTTDISTSTKPSENLLQVRIAALRTISGLVRGHDEFRSMFATGTLALSDSGDPTSAQVVALRATRSEPSAAVRLAAYSALRDSFVVDAGLDLPSSTLLNAMTGSGGSNSYGFSDNRNLSHSSISTVADPTSPANSTLYIAEALKDVLVAWPSRADAAGVFYSASLVTWVTAKAQDARERLLGCYVNGNALLPSIIRVLGKVEREKGPPEVRVSLFALVCVWLHGSASAVSAFLSSAMHLPMLVDIFQSGGSRGDVAEVHVRGLAAVILGICLQVSNGSSDASTDGGFLSGGGGASVALSHSTVREVIRTRIGVTVFTSALDDLRATRAFGSDTVDKNFWKLADSIIPREEKQGYASLSGNVGYGNWYQSVLISVVDDVYNHVSAVALNLVAENPQITASTAPKSNITDANGHVDGSTGPTGEGEAVLADSARDEVLQSYKEFIRTQDDSLNAARVQIDELSTALREAHLELDSKSSDASAARVSEAVDGLRRENRELMSAKEGLEAMLTEKNKDFASLSDAFAALEEENMSRGIDGQDTEALTEAIKKIRNERDVLQQTLDSEMKKNMELSRRARSVNDSIRMKDAEITSISSELEALRANSHPDVVEALQWRTRAEVAESKVEARQATNEALEDEKNNLESLLKESERRYSETQTLVESMRNSMAETKSELDSLRSSRNRELQVSRETSASSAAAQSEIESLREQLVEAKEQLSVLQNANDRSHVSDASEGQKKLLEDIVELRKSLDQAKTELVDSKQAVSQWQKRAEAGEAAKERSELERNRLTNFAKSLESRVKSLSNEVEAQKQNLYASENRVSEIQQQYTELEELRRRAEEEGNELKEELASRTEQSIKLSGQVYEMDESKMKMETELEELRTALATQKELVTSDESTAKALEDQSTKASTAELDALNGKLHKLQTELDSAREELSDSRDKESLSLAQAQDRDTAVAKAELLQKELDESQSQSAVLKEEVEDMKIRLMSLDEAEESKRVLTIQVVELQARLQEQDSTLSSTAKSTEDSHRESSALRQELDEVKKLAEDRLSALTEARNDLSESSSKLLEAEKSLTETSEKLAGVETELATRSRKMAEMEGTLASTSEKLTEAEVSLDSKSKELKGTVTSLAAKSEKLAETQAAFVAMSETLSELQSSFSSSSEKVQEIENERNELATKVANADARLATLQSDKQELLSEVEDLRTKVAESPAEDPTLISKISNLENQLETVHTDRADLEQKLGFKSTACDAAKMEVANLQHEANLLRSEVQAVQERLNSVQREMDNVSLSKEVDNVVGSIVLGASLTASSNDASDRLEQMKAERDDIQASLVAAVEKSDNLEKELNVMRTATKEHEETKSRCVEQNNRLSELNVEVSQLQLRAEEKNKLSEDLLLANEKITKLTAEKDDVARQLIHLRSTLEGSTDQNGVNDSASPSMDDSKAPKRIAELESALRDAARTVTTTNHELIAAQALLVELSSDKTTMRAELSMAEQRIAELTNQMATRSGASSVGGALSEVSDLEHPPAEGVRSLDAGESKDILTEQSLKTAHAETDNLRIALDRSMSEATSAASILECIHSKMGEVETMLKASRLSIQESKSSEKSLEDELKCLQSSYEDEKIRAQRNEESLRSKISEVEQAWEEERKCMESELQTKSEETAKEIASLRSIISNHVSQIDGTRKECRSLREELENTSSSLDLSKERVEELETSGEKLESRLRSTQNEVQQVRDRLTATEDKERELEVSLRENEVKMKHTEEAHARLLKENQEKWQAESREYEEEIDRCNKMLDDAERSFRDSENALKAEIKRIESERQGVGKELIAYKESLQACEIKFTEAVRDREHIEAELNGKLRQKNNQNDSLQKERDSLEAKVKNLTLDREDLRHMLTDSENKVNSTQQALREETELKQVLESENQDFAENLEELEQRCKRVSDELRTMSNKFDASDKERRRLEQSLEDERKVVVQLKKKVHRVEETLRETRLAKSDAETERERLRSELEASEEQSGNWARDNEDLRAWVADLERQATELQSAASDFEEVEQSLRDTLESQRQASEQKARLSDELRKEREALWSAEARARKAERERDSSNSALASCQERVTEMERRLAEIRESNVSKLSASEAGMRAKAQQCAELETALLEAERRVAELGRASDEAFSARAEIRRAEEETTRLRERCEGAEGRVERLEVDLRKAREEMVLVREGSSSEALRALEAEHNELLVYLADLELEVTTLKEEVEGSRE